MLTRRQIDTDKQIETKTGKKKGKILGSFECSMIIDYP